MFILDFHYHFDPICTYNMAKIAGVSRVLQMRAIFFCVLFFRFGLCFSISVSQLLCFSAFCFSACPCFSAFIVLCSSASLLLQFSASLLLRFFASSLCCLSACLPLCLSASLLLGFSLLFPAFPCFSAFSASVLLCFSAFCSSLLLCLPASAFPSFFVDSPSETYHINKP